MKLYTEEFGQEILKLFNEIPSEYQILGTLEELPQLNFLDTLKADDKLVVVSFEPVLFNETTEGDITEHTYTYNVFIFNKLGDAIWLWKDRFSIAQDLFNKLDKWCKQIDNYEDEYLKVKTAQVTILDYSAVTLRAITESDIVKYRLVAVACQVKLDCEFDRTQYYLDTQGGK